MLPHSSTVSDPHSHHWTILGVGAIGSLWASYLALDGKKPRVWLRAAETLPEHVQLKLEPIAEDGDIKPMLSGSVAVANIDHEPISRLLVTTKANNTLEALRSIASRLSLEATVVLLQNGMGVKEEILASFPHLNVRQATTNEGAWRRTDNHVVHAGSGLTYLEGDAELAESLSAGPLKVECVRDIQPLLWRKLAVNCVINPLTAVHRCKNGEVTALSEYDAVKTETTHLVSTLCPSLPQAELSSHIDAVAKATRNNNSSMLVDHSAGRATEIDYLNGFLMRQAVSAGLECPQTQRLYRALL